MFFTIMVGRGAASRRASSLKRTKLSKTLNGKNLPAPEGGAREAQAGSGLGNNAGKRLTLSGCKKPSGERQIGDEGSWSRDGDDETAIDATEISPTQNDVITEDQRMRETRGEVTNDALLCTYELEHSKRHERTADAAAGSSDKTQAPRNTGMPGKVKLLRMTPGRRVVRKRCASDGPLTCFKLYLEYNRKILQLTLS